MDLATLIVDILRRGKENEAANKGGMTAGAQQLPVIPQAVDPKHGGQSYDEIIASMSQ